MSQIKQTYKIKAPLTKVWDALINIKTMQAWGAGDNIIMESNVGGKFSLWGGDIYGTNTLVQAPTQLEQDWVGDSSWPKPSKVRFELSYDKEITTIILTHDELPEAEVDDFAQGWKDYYLGPIKKFLES